MSIYTLYNPGSTAVTCEGTSIPGLSSTDLGMFLRPLARAGTTPMDLASKLASETLQIRQEGSVLDPGVAIQLVNATMPNLGRPTIGDLGDFCSIELDNVPAGDIAPGNYLGKDSTGRVVRGSAAGGGSTVYTATAVLTESGYSGEHHSIQVTVPGARPGDAVVVNMCQALFQESQAAGQRVTINATCCSNDTVMIDFYPSIWLSIPAGSTMAVAVMPV